jgi:RES domain-containing protein
LDPQDAPADLVSIHVEMPAGIRFEQLNVASLPETWRNTPFPRELWVIGERWLVSASSLCLLVPSAVIPDELNLLINPLHSDFKDLRFSEPAEFNFDPRMWK